MPRIGLIKLSRLIEAWQIPFPSLFLGHHWRRPVAQTLWWVDKGKNWRIKTLRIVWNEITTPPSWTRRVNKFCIKWLFFRRCADAETGDKCYSCPGDRSEENKYFCKKINKTTLDNSNSSNIYIPLCLWVVLIKNETLFCMLENCPYFYLLFFCCNLYLYINF